LCDDAHRRIIHNSLKVEATKASIQRWTHRKIDKCNVILFSFTKESHSKQLQQGWTWNLEVVMSYEIRQSQHDNCYRVPLVWETWHSQIHGNRKLCQGTWIHVLWE
jgi:hypothetical protein